MAAAKGEQMRGLGKLLLAAVVGLAVAACGTAAGAGAPGQGAGRTSGSTSSPPEPVDPLLLLGVWEVRGTDEAPDTLLRLDAGELTLWRSCGVLYGSWRADNAGLIVADGGQSGDGRCVTAHDTALTLRPPWRAATTRFRADADTRTLLDGDGAVTARLDPATGSPPADRSRSPFTYAPVEDARARQAFVVPNPLPAGLRPATRATLVGRWVPDAADAVQPPRVPFLQLDADGSWTASDGCNSSTGRWTAGGDGRVLATSGYTTLIGCQNVPVDQWWDHAARAGFDGPALVLLDRTGSALARLSR
jgi:hypothetical protein